MKITVKQNGKAISIESADPAAGVPDVTQGAGPDLLKLQDNAQKAPTDPQAEFDATKPATQTATEKTDKPEEAGEKANESAMAGFIKGLTPAQKKQLAGILSKESDEPTDPAAAATEPATPETPAAPETEPAADDGVGEVTQNPGETVIEANGLTITVTDDAAGASPETEPAPAGDPEPDSTAAETTDSADPNAAPAAGAATGTESAGATLDDFFANLNLANL